MYQINDYVRYRNNGIYRVIDICEEQTGSQPSRTYYVLQAVYQQNSTVYVPVDTPNLEEHLCTTLSKQEVQQIIEQAKNQAPLQWISNPKQRAVSFKEVLQQGDRAKILWLLQALGQYCKTREQENKKSYVTDERMLATAKKIISEEFAFSLEMEPQEVIPYLLKTIK